jgi:hypothetical protein
MGAVPFQEAKCALVGNRVMSPASTNSRAAPDGPIPSRLVSVVAAALSAAFSSLSAAFLRWWIRSRSLISSAATRRRAWPAASRGRTHAKTALTEPARQSRSWRLSGAWARLARWVRDG